MHETMGKVRRLLLATPPAASQAAQQTLQQMVSETAGFAALTAASVDPQNPGLVWDIAAPRKWLGHSVPGSRFAFDNPDNVYRYAIIDDASTYVLDTQANGPTGRLSVTVYRAFVGAQTKNWEQPVDAAGAERIKSDSQGAARITIGPVDPKDGTLYLNSRGGRMLLVREAVYDWQTQRPRTISLRRVSGPKARPLTFDETVATAQEYLIAATRTVIDLDNNFSPMPTNSFGPTVARGFGKSMIKVGRFQIADDEALIVNVRPQAAEYIGVTVTSPWLITRDYVDRTGSRANRQSHQNPDGSYTYVVSSRDPGVANWLDTDGLLDGAMAVRWEGMNAPEANPDDAIERVKLVKLSAIRGELPSGFPSVSATDRSTEKATRRRDYETRCGVPCRVYAGAEGD
ncbi:hypothetical protein [Rhizorhabdus argentea]|uniref:hypothetical protein n=1 Tax=Rhizorhabdus argentea TaxID=1387174 RepID=UPI0030EBA2BD